MLQNYNQIKILKMKSYIINIISISIIVSLIAFVLFYFALQQYYLQIFPVMILFFAVSNFAIYYILTKAGKKNIRQFSTYFMASIGLKLFIYMGFIITYVVMNRENAMNFVIQFFALYIIYTVYETQAISKTLRKQSNSDNAVK